MFHQFFQDIAKLSQESWVVEQDVTELMFSHIARALERQTPHTILESIGLNFEHLNDGDRIKWEGAIKIVIKTCRELGGLNQTLH